MKIQFSTAPGLIVSLACAHLAAWGAFQAADWTLLPGADANHAHLKALYDGKPHD